jgi:hypothetical protein
VTTLGEVVVIGGGCYGGFYLGQLATARAAGALEWDRLLVVDRDPDCAAAASVGGVAGAELVVANWDSFLDSWLQPAERTPLDRLVPSPFMPHLMADWLLRRARERWPGREVAMLPAETPVGTPYDRLHHGDGVRYLSHADWICPVHCIEPITCPAITAPRSWEMGETITRWTLARARQRPTVGPALFTCRHESHGVGMYPVVGAFAALASLADRAGSGGPVDLVVGSVSACHGALAVLGVGPA